MGPPNRPNPGQRRETPSADDNDDDDYDTTDSPSRGPSVRSRRYQERIYQRDVSTIDEVMDDARGYVTAFIADRMDRDGYNVPDEMRHATRNIKQDTAIVLRQIGDDLDSHQQLNNLLNQISISPDTAFETFASIASEIFTDGVINWGRIVTVIYLGYKMAFKLLFEGGLWKTIIKWILKFIGERLAHWILNSGGWDTCKSYLGSTSAQMVGVFLAGCALTALVFWLKKS